jgi:hypothetical protein
LTYLTSIEESMKDNMDLTGSTIPGPEGASLELLRRPLGPAVGDRREPTENCPLGISTLKGCPKMKVYLLKTNVTRLLPIGQPLQGWKVIWTYPVGSLRSPTATQGKSLRDSRNHAGPQRKQT